MTKSFEVHFDTEGNIVIDNIKGVEGDECLALTKPYIQELGEVVKTKRTNTDEEKITPKQNESAK